MRLTALRIRRLPGIRSGFDVEGLDSGVSLVLGPNASGKTSLIRALRYLLSEPARDDPLELSLEAEFSGREGVWKVLREGSRVEWRRDGTRADPPPLPDARFQHCHWLTVEDLLALEHREDEQIADRLRQELAGGFDVEALLRGHGPFQVGARHGRTEAGELREARRVVAEVRQEYRGLQKDRERLPELARGIASRARSAERISRTEAALELLAARRARLEAEAALHVSPASPEEMRRLRGDEGRLLDGLDEKRRNLAQEDDSLRRDEKQAEAALRGSGLAEDRPSEEALASYRAILQRARDLYRDWHAVGTDLDRARGRERDAAARLGAGEDEAPRLDPAAISQAEELAVQMERARQTVQELEARLEGMPSPPTEEEVEAHREGTAALRGWLAASATGLERIALPALLALAGSLAAGVAVVADRGGLAVGAVALSATAAAVAVALGWRAAQERRSARMRFGRTGVEPPQEWIVSSVTRRLDDVEARLQELRAREAGARRGEGDRERLDAQRKRLEVLETEKEALARDVGFNPDWTAGSLHEFLRLVDEHHGARVQVAEAEEGRSRLEADIRKQARCVRSFLVGWGEEVPGQEDVPEGEEESAPGDLAPDLEILNGALDRLARRASAAERARETLRRVAEDLDRLARNLEDVTRDQERIYRDAGLELGDRTALDRRLEDLTRFRERAETFEKTRIGEETLQARLKGEDELLSRVEADDEGGLRAEIERLEEEARVVEELKEERATTAARLRDAGTSRRLEEAMAREAEARAALEGTRDQALMAEAGAFLLEHVKERHRRAAEPEVLQDARARFSRFTHHRWTLELGDDTPFVARDEELGEVRTLSQLSSGTRMQLLLALRVAWARFVERGQEPLPLFLDEALTTSDPERFSEVAASLSHLARAEGRQVVYLSAQPTDLLFWRQALGHEPKVVDLARIRFGCSTEPGSEAFALPERDTVPVPEEGEAPEAWAARAGVPPVNPWEDPGGIHLFHLLRDDPFRLYDFMSKWGLQVQGQLESILVSPAGDVAVPNPEDRRRLAARCRIARRWIEGWRKGRGRPVDRGVMERSGAVSDTFLNQVAELAQEIGGEPRALLRALPGIPWYRNAKVKELEQWLEEEGYLLPGTLLTASEREAVVLREAAGLAEPGEVREVVQWLEAGLATDQR